MNKRRNFITVALVLLAFAIPVVYNAREQEPCQAATETAIVAEHEAGLVNVKTRPVIQYEWISDTMEVGLEYTFQSSGQGTAVELRYSEGKGKWDFDAGGNATLAGQWDKFRLDSEKRLTGYINGEHEVYKCDTLMMFESPGIIVIKPYTEGIVYNFLKPIK